MLPVSRKLRYKHKTHKKTYGRHTCKWCKKHYTRKHARQQYCSQHCSLEARREQDREWQHRHRRQRKRLGTTHISQHRHPDYDIEQMIINKEKKRTME